MKIVVCVKHVPEGSARLDPGSKRLDRSGEGALNHFDANAVEEALRLKSDGDDEVVVISVGPERAADSLRKALAMGADRAVLVSDEAAAGSDLVATSNTTDAGTDGTTTIAGQTWNVRRSNRGEEALTLTTGGLTVVVTGSAPDQQLRTLAGSLS